MRSTSALVTGMKLLALSRREGTLAMRLSVIVSRAPEKMLLKPRVTTLLCTRPVLAKSTPGWSRTCSEILRTERFSISSASTMEIDAGASNAFSWLREAETTLCSRSITVGASSTSSVVPACPTRTPLRARDRKPMWLMRTS